MYSGEYKKKLTSAEEAVGPIPAECTIVHGMAAGEPPALLGAVADRARAGGFRRVRIYTLLPMAHASKTVLDPALSDVIHPHTWFVSASDRNLVRVGLNEFVPNEFHEVPRLVREMSTDAVLTAVSPMDRAGFFTFGVVNDYISTAARHCRRLIVEVNPRMPRVFGNSLVHISEVDAIVENEAPLMEIIPAEPKTEAEAIGRSIAELIPDGATIQLGFGGIPNAVASYLDGHRDLGLHTELFCPGMVGLIKKGVITGRKKNLHVRKHVFTNALGDREMYDFMDDNPSLASYPVSHTNNPHIIALNENMISINSTIEVDLLGQCNSEYLGGYQFSGTGGQLDFVRGAYDSRGGKSFIAFYSTAKGGTVSRIVLRFEPGAVVTTPRMNTHYLVTEYGVANLKGLTTQERAMKIIGLAHPAFRDDLLREAQNMRLI
jgi:itaconate CoA-transferase